MAVLKLSQIGTTGTNPVVSDFLIGVLNSNSTDNKVTFTQVAGTIIGGASGGIQFNSSSMFSADTGFTYAGNGQVSIAFGTVTTNVKALNITGTWNNSGQLFDAPIFMNIVNTASTAGSKLADFQVGGTSILTIGMNPSGNGGAQLVGDGPSSSQPIILMSNTDGLTLQAGTNFSQLLITANVNVTKGNLIISQNQIVIGSNSSICNLYVDGANFLLGIGNTTHPTTFRVYNTTDMPNSSSGNTTVPTNYERLVLDWTTSSNVAIVGTQQSGSGSARPVSIVTGGTQALRLTTGQSALVGSTTIATNSTDGFIYIPAAAGTPVGTPTTQTGFVPMYLDTTNSQLWLYLGGAWKQPKTPSAAALVTWQ